MAFAGGALASIIAGAMAQNNAIELISPDGETTFVELDARGISNIGSHSDNQIVVPDPRVSEFQALLDHRQKPFQLIVFGESPIVLNGEQLAPNANTVVTEWDTIEIAGHSLLLMDGVQPPLPPRNVPQSTMGGLAAAAPLALAAGVSVGAAQFTPEVAAGAATPGVPVPVVGSQSKPLGLGNAVRDQLDDFVVLDVPDRSFDLLVEQTANILVNITNGGSLVAEFVFQVQGVDPSWVLIDPPTLNLKESNHGSVMVSITPPRHYTTTSGPMHFALIAFSPNYPGHQGVNGVVINIAPFHEFELTEPVPRQQTVTWGNRTGALEFAVANKSNTEAVFRFDGQDDQAACNMEFKPEGNANRSARAVEFPLKPGVTSRVTAFITPTKRQLVALRPRDYSLNLTGTLMASALSPRGMFAQLSARPLIGPGILLLTAILLAVLVGLIFTPRVYEFDADPKVVEAGKPALLHWSAKTFSELRIEPELGAVAQLDGTRAVTPKDTTIYRISADNWLSRLVPFIAPKPREVQVVVLPKQPFISKFVADKGTLLTGENLTVFWEVLNADELVLKTNGAPETIPPEQRNAGLRKLAPENNTTFELTAKNYYGEVTANFGVKVNPPTPTPIPPPVIVQFDVKPSVITAGQEIQITWEATGAERVEIKPLVGADNYPPKGSVGQKPDKNTTYVLTAFSQGKQVSRQAAVLVGPAPTATPVPIPPSIEFFTASSQEVVIGSAAAADLNLVWSVKGDVKTVDINAGDLGKLTGLGKSGSITVTLAKTTLFVLTAMGEKDSASQTTNVKALEPTPTPTPPPTATPPPPPPQITNFSAANGDSPVRTQDISQILDPALAANTFKYSVAATSKVKMSWSSALADSATLDGASVPTASDFTFIAKVDGETHKLVATGAGGSVNRFIVISLRPKPVPPVPTGFTGTFTPPGSKTPPIVLSWNYSQTSRDQIIGFRIYRALTIGGAFTRLIDENTLGTAASTFSDMAAAPTCGRTYYIVAVYTKSDATIAETSSSTTSWATGSCP